MDDITRVIEVNILSIIKHQYPQMETLLSLPDYLFSHSDTRTLFSLLANYREQGKSFDNTLLRRDLRRRGEDESVLDEVSVAAAVPTSADEYVNEVISHYKERATDSLISSLESGKVKDYRTAIEKLLSRYDEADSIRVPRKRATTMTETAALVDSLPYIPSLTTGLDAVDWVLSDGFRREEMTAVGALPGTGKTALAAVLALNVANQHEQGSSIIFSKEMNKTMIYRRLLAKAAHVTMGEVGKYYSPKETVDERIRGKIESAKKLLNHVDDNYNFFDIGDSRIISTDTILEEVHAQNQYRKKLGKDPIFLVVVDYLQILNYDQGRNTIAYAIGEVAAKLKEIALREHCHMLVISAINRAAGKSMVLEAFRDSSGIDFNTENGIIMRSYAEEMGAEKAAILGQSWEDEWMNPILLKNVKCRNGIMGRNGYLCFNGAEQSFRDMTDNEREIMEQFVQTH